MRASASSILTKLPVIKVDYLIRGHMRQHVLLTPVSILVTECCSRISLLHGNLAAACFFIFRQGKTIEKSLQDTGGNKSEAARRLGVSRVTLWKWIKKHGIQIDKQVRKQMDS